MSDHILHITEVTKYGTEYDLECVGHDKKTCNLQTWWFNEWDDLLKLDPIDIPIPVRAEWNNSNEPTIVLAAAEPAVTITWDGSDEVLGEIARLFPTSTLYPHTHIQGRNAFGDIRIVDYARYPKTGSAGILVLGGRIRIEGDSFAILPPEEVPS